MRVDPIVDDGSHLLAHQLTAVRLYRALLAPGGILVIEDVVDIGSVRPAFEAIGPCAIYDLRAAKGRYDDVLVVFGSVDRPRT
jgi:cephalosporin hydroxylase